MAAGDDLTMGSGRFERAKPIKLKKQIRFSQRVLDARP